MSDEKKGGKAKEEASKKQEESKETPGTQLAIFGSREQSTRGNPIQVRASVRAFRLEITKVRVRDGQDAHGFGTELTRMFHLRADEVYGRQDFLQFAKKELGLSVSSVRRYVRIARYATAAQSAWGMEAVLLAASIVDLFASDAALCRKHGLSKAPTRITEIAKIELQVSAGKIRLADAPGEELIEEALEILKGTRAPGQRRLPTAMRQKNAEIRKAIDAEPELQGVTAQFVERGGKRRFDLSIPPGGNLTRIARAVERVLERL